MTGEPGSIFDALIRESCARVSRSLSVVVIVMECERGNRGENMAVDGLRNFSGHEI